MPGSNRFPDTMRATDIAAAVITCCDKSERCSAVCRISPSDGISRADVAAHAQSVLAPRTCSDSGSATKREAAAECAAHGLRLCARATVAAAGCCRAGCGGFTSAPAWARDGGPAPVNQGCRDAAGRPMATQAVRPWRDPHAAGGLAGGVLHTLRAPRTAPRLLLFVTTALSALHLEFLRRCWPAAINASELLREAAVLVHGVGDARCGDEQTIPAEWRRAAAALPAPAVGIFGETNPGYAEGAMLAMRRAVERRWFAPQYEWVVRVQPDTLLLRGARLARPKGAHKGARSQA